MSEPPRDPALRPDDGTRYAAIMLGTWTLAIGALAALVWFDEVGLASRVRLLDSTAGGVALPVWALLLAAIWLLGLAILAVASRAGNQAVRGRVRALELQRQSEARFRLFMQHVPGVAFVKDPDGRYLYASESFERYFGLKPADTLGKTDADLWPTDAARFRADDERVLRTGEPVQVLEETSFGPQPASWLTLKFPLPQLDGPPHLGGLSVDIITQRRAERDLLESQRRLSTLLRNLPGMAYRARPDDERTLEFCSGGAIELTGFSPDELVGNHRASFGRLIHPDDRERVGRVLQNAVRNNTSYRLSYRLVTRNGLERHVWEQGRPVPTDVPEVRALEGFVADVTERKRAEDEVERRAAGFRLLFDQAPTTLLVEDFSICRRRVAALLEGGVTDVRAWFREHPGEASRLAGTVRILDANAAAVRDWFDGKPRETLLEAGDHLLPGALHLFVEMLVATAAGETHLEFEGRTDRTGRDVLVLFAVLPGHEHDYARVLVSLQDLTLVRRGEVALRDDVTDLRAAEARLTDLVQQLEASNADLRQLAWFVSHDFTEPLRTVSGFVKLLAERVGPSLDERARDYVEHALGGTARMERMIDAVLGYARVSTRELELGPVSLDAALADAVGNLQLTLTEAGARVTHEPLPNVQGDPSFVTLLLQNLLSNAVKYRGPDAPLVRVTAAVVDGRVVVHVADNGLGIAPEHRERVFQSFQRPGASPDVPGTGIGLALCRRVVERLGGSIRVEPVEGPGTTFRIELPAPPTQA
jgi:PAS domain S-box-containing protein